MYVCIIKQLHFVLARAMTGVSHLCRATATVPAYIKKRRPETWNIHRLSLTFT